MQDVRIAVGVVTADLLKANNLDDLTDIQEVTPGLTVETGGFHCLAETCSCKTSWPA